jgi:putative ABC transport system ATP-binding protein
MITEARPPAARAVDLVRTYGRGDAAVHALAGVSLDVPAARFTAIMGPSGSGKSTLMHLLAGLDAATSGRVLLGGTDLGACRDAELTAIRRDRVGFVFQSFNLLPQLTAAQNIDLPARLAGRRTDPAWRAALVDLLGLGSRLAHRPAELSGGQQQRVALARALLGRPDVVFADEPTGNLDSKTGGEILELLRTTVEDYGQTLVMVTHDAVAASKADRILFLADGRIVRDAGRLTPPEVSAAITELSA